MKIEGDELVFSSGRRRYANGAIIGLRADANASHADSITGGYDHGMIDLAYEHEESEPLTPADIRELAQHMQARWRQIEIKAVDP